MTFVCNITNLRSIAYAYGDDLDSWIGKEITLSPTQVSIGNDMVDTIRVRVVKQDKGKPKFMQNEAPLDDSER